MKRFSQELEQLASSVAEQVCRSRDRSQFFEWTKHRILHALDHYERVLDQIKAKSEPRTPLNGYTPNGREENRTHNLRSMTGYGSGCDICNGGFEAKTFMTLRIGNYKANLFIDLCLPCTKRLAKVVDARLEDGRRNKISS